jgi:hypothetical protein
MNGISKLHLIDKQRPIRAVFQVFVIVTTQTVFIRYTGNGRLGNKQPGQNKAKMK